MQKTKENILDPTPEQIAEWKNLYGNVYKITVGQETEWVDDPDNPEEQKEIVTDPGKTCYLRPPSRKILAYAQTANVRGTQLQFNEALLNGCWLGGDPAIKTNDVYFISIGAHLSNIIEIKESKLEKI